MSKQDSLSKDCSHLFLVALLIFISGARLFAQQDYTDKQIFPSSNPQTENSIAINPTNPQNILVSTIGRNEYDANGNFVTTHVTRFYTTDGGNNWTGNENNPAGITTSGDPIVFFTANGNACYAYLGLGGNGVYVSKSTDQGATWGSPINAVSSSSAGGEDKPHAIADASGTYPNNIYVIWTGREGSFPQSPLRMYFSRSTNGGASFEAKQQLNSGDRNRGANLAIGPDGTIYAAWASLPSNSSSNIEDRIIIRKSTDGGQSFVGLPSPYITGIGNYENSGQDVFNGIKVNSFPSMGVDRSPSTRNGWVYIAYADKSTGDADIYLHWSTNAGVSWSNAIRVNSDISGTQQWFPSLSVDQVTGNIFISYYNMVGPNYSTKRYMAISTDGGTTFTQNPVSDVSFTPTPLGTGFPLGYMGDYYETAANGSQAFACWSDNRSGIFQAYISRFSMPVTITVDQKLENSTRIGTIGRWNTNSFSPRLNPLDMFTAQGGTSEVLQGDQAIYSNQKYYQWNSDPDVTNHHSFAIDGAVDIYTSNFKPVVSAVTFKNELIDVPGLNGGTVDFKDPWLIDYTDQNYGNTKRNRGLTAPYRSRSVSPVPFSPDLSTSYNGDVYRGVFLNENPLNDPTKPIYSVNAPTPQTLGGYNSGFVGWSSPGALVVYTTQNVSPVIFYNANDVITAKYKGQLISTTNAAVASNSQRKIVKTVQSIYSSVDKLFTAYESAGGVFFLYKDLSDGSWSGEKPVEGLPTSTIQYRSPTLFTDSAAQKFFMLYDKVDLAANTHKIQFSSHDPGSNSMSTPLTLSTLYLSSTYQTTPTVASVPRKNSTTPPLIAAAWCNQNAIGFALGTAITDQYFGITTMQFTSIGELAFPLFPSGSFVNPTNVGLAISYLAGQSPFYVFHLVWEEAGETGGIKYARGVHTGTAWPPQLSSITWSPSSSPQTYLLAPNNEMETFTKPSIAVDGSGNVYVAWEYYNPDVGGQIQAVKIDGSFPPTIYDSYDFPAFPVEVNLPYLPSLSDYRYSTTKPNDMTLVYHRNTGTMCAQYTAAQSTWSLPYTLDATGRQANVQGSVTTSDVNRSVVYMGSTGPPYAVKTMTIPPPPIQPPVLSGTPFLYNNSYRPKLTWTATGSTYKLYRYTCANNGVDCNNYANQVLVYQGAATTCTDYGVIIGNSSSNSKVYYYVYAYDASGQTSSPISNKVSFVTNIVQKALAHEEVELPIETKLQANYPNPFNPKTEITYQLAEDGFVTLRIYDVLGKEVTVLINDEKSAGYYSVSWDASGEASGMYYMRMVVVNTSGKETYQEMKKLLLTK